MIPLGEAAMLKFLQRFSSQIIGALNGLDRIRFRGTKRMLASVGGLIHYFNAQKVLNKDYMPVAMAMTEQLKEGIEEQAKSWGHPVDFVPSSQTRKEDVALNLAQQRGIQEGLIAILSCVEPCYSFRMHRHRQEKKLQVHYGSAKCLHYYHYYLDRRFGLIHTRTQSWLPFTVQTCLNGREWLARQLDEAGIGYVKKDNCFVDIADLPAAQQLFDQLLRTDWCVLLDSLMRQGNPRHDALFGAWPVVPYYWSVEQSEWASDVMFRSADDLAALMPRWVRHGLEVCKCVDVLRFLGARRLAERGKIGHFEGAVVSDFKRRREGVRLLHRVNHNSLKMYDKQGSVLRVETTINDPRDLKVFRTKEGDDEGEPKWLPMRRGVADLYRRTQVSQKSNERYLESLAAVEETQPLGKLVERLSKPAQLAGRRVRALNPLAAADATLLECVGRGEFLINGFRNRDLRSVLYSCTPDEAERKRQTAAVTRQLRLLRAHGVIHKVTKTQRYMITAYGRHAIAALAAAKLANVKQLLDAA
jgi:hypothetical protein